MSMCPAGAAHNPRAASESRRLTAGAAGAAGAAQVGWAVTPSSDGAKANRCCCANESGDTRLVAAGRANRDSGGRRQPADTDGLSEVKLPPHVGPVVRQPWRRDVCMQTARHPGDRTCQLGSTRALVARGGVATRNRAGCGGRINYSQLMKTRSRAPHPCCHKAQCASTKHH